MKIQEYTKIMPLSFIHFLFKTEEYLLLGQLWMNEYQTRVAATPFLQFLLLLYVSWTPTTKICLHLLFLTEIFHNQLIFPTSGESEIKPFSTNVPLLYPLKTSENLWFSDVLREQSGTLLENGLVWVDFSWETGNENISVKE